MGKTSSSSIKKKRSKVSSSRGRIKKRSKSRTRRKSKSKKLPHRDDSVSYSSDSDDSMNSVSVSSSCSEDDHRSRRSRSRTRKDVKSSKKRARRQSSSSEKTEDAPLFKKRKGSKKNGDFQVRKKTHEKKKKKLKEKKKEKKKKKNKSKWEVSVSSTSSGSWSCSTCQGGSGSSDESEVEKNRGWSERRDKDRRRVEKVKSGSKRSRSRSRSFSSCSRYNDYRSDEQLTGEVNVRRLRSVITVVREGNEERGMNEDEHKEEMVYDYDDYPPSRSNDSNDGGSKREFVHNYHVTTKEKRHAEDEKGEVVSNIRSGKVTETDKDSDDYDENSPCDGFKMNDVLEEKRNDDSGVADSPNAYNLESILRQKALENLRTFRRGHQTDAKAPVNQKDLIHSDVKRLSSTKAELFQNKSSKGGGARAVVTSQVAGDDSIPAASKSPTEISQNDKNLSDGNNGYKNNGAKHDVAHPPDRVALASSPNKVNKTFGSESYKPRLISLASRREPSNASINKKQESALREEPPQAKSITGNSVAHCKVETAQTEIDQLGKTNCEEVNNARSSASDDTSCLKSISGGISSNKPQDEAKDDSQLEQKTMTVMRGGELVEVSYKVYIPKKAPALSRRPLKR
ncbi:uncharacterized protein DDB_G0287625 [Pistacia vera]|uniref:uncharacterized protein DDB_G0287625 n=1 Tax=Pistacia vera TaxID=55513 RepID=UPI001263AC7C|nr:uncharacterized protein DDB_G0287625 [Pistacia vera]